MESMRRFARNIRRVGSPSSVLEDAQRTLMLFVKQSFQRISRIYTLHPFVSSFDGISTLVYILKCEQLE